MSLDTLKFSVYRWAMGRSAAELLGREGRGKVETRAGELLYYLYRKGAWSRVRGALIRWRLKEAGRRLFVGARAEILFPDHLSVGDNVAIGKDCYLNCLSLEGVRLGDNVRLKQNVWLQVTSHLTERGKGITIGENGYIGPYCLLGGGGGITLGRNVTLGASVDLLAENHRFDSTEAPINQQGVIRKGIVIEDDCWIGNKAVILDGVTIGRGSVVGAASVVTRDVSPGSVVAGNPARMLRSRLRAEQGA